jgi:hypothetical protein
VLVIEIIEHFYKLASFCATKINGLPAFCKPAAVDFRPAKWAGRSLASAAPHIAGVSAEKPHSRLGPVAVVRAPTSSKRRPTFDVAASS